MPVLSLPLVNSSGEKRIWSGAFSAGLSLSIAEASQQHKGPILVVASSARSASQIESEISVF